MRRIIMFTLLALTTFGGVAAANPRDHRGGVRVQDSRHWQQRPTYQYNAPRTYTYSAPRTYTYSRPSYQYVRRPIYVQRPVIRSRYFNYYQRPALIVESYPAMDGYYWVQGHWDWDGYEWIWNPGHYEPNTPAAPHYYDDGHVSDYGDSYSY